MNNANLNAVACGGGDLGSIPGLGRSPGEGKGYPVQYCGLENSTDCIVHGVANSRTRLSDFHTSDVGSQHKLLFDAHLIILFDDSWTLVADLYSCTNGL